jgi:hypothetical protein
VSASVPVVPSHFHRRGKVISDRYVAGRLIRTFGCSEPWCDWTVEAS